LNLGSHSFPFHLAAHRVLIGEELNALLETLLLDRLELYHCSEGFTLLDLSQTVEDVEGAEDWHVLLFELGRRARVGDDHLPHGSGADCDLPEVYFCLVDGENLADGGCRDFYEVDLS
jgi:hypothetical protein